MADGERERIGGIAGKLDACVKAECFSHHPGNLVLVGMAEGGDGELDGVGGIFEELEAALGLASPIRKALWTFRATKLRSRLKAAGVNSSMVARRREWIARSRRCIGSAAGVRMVPEAM
jgi:hypothetical protein